MIFQVGRYFANQLSVMCARLVQPENRRRTGGASAANSQTHPVTDRRILRLTHTPDIAFSDVMFNQHITGFIDDTNRARGRHFKGFVV